MLQQFVAWTHNGVVCGELSPVEGTPYWSRERTPFPEQQEKKKIKNTHNPHSLSHCAAEGKVEPGKEKGMFLNVVF